MPTFLRVDRVRQIGRFQYLAHMSERNRKQIQIFTWKYVRTLVTQSSHQMTVKHATFTNTTLRQDDLLKFLSYLSIYFINFKSTRNRQLHICITLYSFRRQSIANQVSKLAMFSKLVQQIHAIQRSQ